MKFFPKKDYIRIIESMPVVCVDGLILNEKKEVLLVKRKNQPLAGEYWMPGGRLYKGETLEEGIRRKIKQELGVSIIIEKPLGYFEEFFEKTSQNVKSGFHAISFIFLGKIRSSGIKLDNQSEAWGWFKELPDRLLQIKPVQEFWKR